MAYYEIAYIYLSLSCENFSTYIFYYKLMSTLS